MEASAATSCLRFLESQADKYHLFIRTGGVTIGRQRQSRGKVDEQVAKAKTFIEKGASNKEAAFAVGMNEKTLYKRLKNEK